MLLPKRVPTRLRGQQMSALRARCYARDEGKCVDCGRNDVVWEPLELSHDIPRSLGGEDTEENCHMRCRTCHRKRDHHGQPGHY